jgi:hypothetical protein
MKLNRRDLRRLIESTIRESMSSEMKLANEVIDYGTTIDYMVKNSSRDALDLFDAMRGFDPFAEGEKAVKKVFAKRKNDLKKLNDEFSRLIKILLDPPPIEKLGSTGASLMSLIGGDDFEENLGMERANWDFSLADWLKGDGLEEESEQIRKLVGK